MRRLRTNTRKVVLQALYQWQMTDQNPSQIEQQFIEAERLKYAEKDYFVNLFYGVYNQCAAVDKILLKFVDRAIAEIDPVELAVLRMCTYELLHCPEVPYKVIINEGVNLAKAFGAETSYKYINGILDKVAQQRRNP